MSDLDLTPPQDLIGRRRDFPAAEAAHRELLAEWPTPTALLAGAEVSEQLRARTDGVHKDMENAAVDVVQHAWWSTVQPSRRHEAEAALRAAARTVL